MRFSLPAIVVIALVQLASIEPANAAWTLDGVVLANALNEQSFPTIISDGAGGAIVTWHDRRSGTYDIYAQRVNAAGVAQWTADGVALCTAINDQYFPYLISDGAGGAIVTWYDARTGTNDIYAQRVNAAGNVLWTANGVALCTASGNQSDPRIAEDGSGGAIVTWSDPRAGLYDVYAQRVNATGIVQWAANGVVITSAASDQFGPRIVSDGAGGVIIVWVDYRNANADAYVQRVNAAGTPQWTANGVALCTAANSQEGFQIVTDGAAGAIVTWMDFRSGNYDIYARHVNSSGVPQWTANGVALVVAANTQGGQTMVADGVGGAIVAWYDNRSGTSDIYAQRVNSSGVLQWTANGLALCTAADNQTFPTIVSAGAADAIVAWSDSRNGAGTSDIYAQRIQASGAVQWAANGVVVSSAANDQLAAATTSNGADGAIVTWQDARTGVTDIYVQRVEGDYGTWGRPEPFVTSVSDVPSDQGGKVAVNWTRSEHDALPLQVISHYSVWRAVDEVALASYFRASGDDAWVDPASIGSDFDGAAITKERINNVDYHWEWVANQNATHDAGYSLAATTREDSVSGDLAVHYFRVIAHTADPFILYKSNAVGGYSVDNLAPTAPLQLIAQRVGADVHLEWNGVRVPDLRDYSVYRATASGVTPVPINFLTSEDDTLLLDANAPITALYYIVTAYDVHDNQSAPSNEAGVQALTGIGNTPPVTALTVLQNHPNPFATSTTLQVGLAAASNVEINVFDVAGRKVRGIKLEGVAAGWRSIPFDARDERGRSLASGVYFYRVSANGTTVARKMIIAR